MPYGRTRPRPWQAAIGGFVGGVGQAIGMAPEIKRQQLERERKGRQDILSAMKEEAKFTAEAYGKEGPEYNAIVLKILAEMRGEEPGQRGQVVPGVRQAASAFMPTGEFERGVKPFETRQAKVAEAQARHLGKMRERERGAVTTAAREEKATLRKRAEQLMKQRRDFLRGDPIMTALGGLIQPQWSDEEQGVELNNILSDLRLSHRFTYPKSVMDALKLAAPALGPPKPTVKEDSLGLFK